jgi:hypothetical protein
MTTEHTLPTLRENRKSFVDNYRRRRVTQAVRVAVKKRLAQHILAIRIRGRRSHLSVTATPLACSRRSRL